MKIDETELKKKLTPQQYHVLREKGTETPFSGKLLNNKKTGMYTCAVCGREVFSSDTKFDSTAPGLIGWPSFSDVAKSDAVKLVDDTTMGMHRIEVQCANCGSHLGHFFEDPASKNNKHYCINSCALDFKPKENKN